MFLSKIQERYFHTWLYNNRKTFLFKLIGDQFNIVGCNLRFNRSLNAV